jgi:hypothetical protein
MEFDAVKLQIVTGYVPIPDHPRTPMEYGELGEKLAQVRAAPVKAYYTTVQDCWLFRTLKAMDIPVTHSKGDNPAKNSLAYHIVQHQKFQWLAQALAHNEEAETFIWMDYGIFHLPGVTKEIVEDFLGRIRPDDLAIPGCWDKGEIVDTHPCWRFCGSMAIVPRKYVNPLNYAVKNLLFAHLKFIKNVPWEVNTWATVERANLVPIRWYKADHNETMFTNYPGDTDAA